MSKIKNRTATTKNCIENGIRRVELFTNPHSNALLLDFSVFLLVAIVLANMRKDTTRIVLITCIERNFKIFYSFTADWKSVVFFYFIV